MISAFYQNCRGVKTKLNSIRKSILLADYDIICITETWLNEGIFSSELFDDRYDVFRKDRNLLLLDKNDGGGVLIAVKKQFKAISITVSADCFDDVWVDLHLLHGRRLLIGAVYFPVRSSSNQLDVLTNKISDILLSRGSNTNFLILGDFNLSKLNWITNADEVILDCSSDSSNENLFFKDFLSLNDLKQFNAIRNANGRLLDLVLSNASTSAVQVLDGSFKNISTIDVHHPPLLINIKNITAKFQPKLIPNKVNFNKVNITGVVEDLSLIDWESYFCNLNMDETVSAFYMKLEHIIFKNNPNGSSSFIRRKQYPKWYSNYLIKLIDRKDSARKKAKIYGTSHHVTQYRFYRQLTQKITLECYNRYISDVENNIAQDSKGFWKFNNSLRATSDYPYLMKYNDIESDAPSVIADCFATHFNSVFMPTISYINHNNLSNVQCRMSELVISETDVENAINQLDVSKNAGADGLPSRFIKNIKAALVKPLTLIYNQSLQSAIFPIKFKESFIIPIFKNGDKSDIHNYRPISILSVFNKIFEKIVHHYLFGSIKDLISRNQHGFFSNRSTVTNLVEFSHSLFSNIDINSQTDCIYTDFSKAFDLVNHSLLLNKLKLIGIKGNMVKWFESYLTNRVQFVMFNGFKSYLFSPTSGVPQGSILGPLLFIIFINDLLERFSCSSLFYADDCKIYNTINNVRDCIALQRDIDCLLDWSILNNLPLNINKCCCLTFSKKKNLVTFDYKMQNQVLSRVHKIKDLGILLDSRLSFSEHINNICSKASRLLGFVLRRSQDFTKPETLISLFYSLVRSGLEYASQIWNPLYNTYAERIERIQRKFTRFLFYKYKLSVTRVAYSSRLTFLNMVSLQHRRIYLDEIFLFKLLNNLFDTSITSLLQFRNTPYPNRNNFLFLPSTVRTNIGLSSPIFRLQSSHNAYFSKLNLFSVNLCNFKKNALRIVGNLNAELK